MRIDDNLEKVVSAFLHDSRNLQTRTTEDLNFIVNQVNNLRAAIVDIIKPMKDRNLKRNAESLIRKLTHRQAKVNKILHD